MIFKRFRIGLLTLVFASTFAGCVLALMFRWAPWKQIGEIARPVPLNQQTNSRLWDFTVVSEPRYVLGVWYYWREPYIEKNDRLRVCCWSIAEEKVLWTTPEIEGRLGVFTDGNESTTELLVIYCEEKFIYSLDLKDGSWKNRTSVQTFPEQKGRSNPTYFMDYRVNGHYSATGGPFIGIYKRNRPDSWWGIAWLPEFWMAVVFGTALFWSLRRDFRMLQDGRKPAPELSH